MSDDVIERAKDYGAIAGVALLGTTLSVLAGYCPPLLPLSFAWTVAEAARGRSAERKRLEHVRVLFEEQRNRDAEQDRRLDAMEKAIAEGREEDAARIVRSRDVRQGFAALGEAVIAEEPPLVQACVQFAGNAFAGRAGGQASIAALDALPKLSVDGLALLRWLVNGIDREQRQRTVPKGSVNEGDLDGLVALGLVQRSVNIVRDGVVVSIVGFELVEHTAGRK